MSGAHDSAGEPSLVVASYNIHRCIGRDRRYDPARTARVIRELDADVVALQEVETQGALESHEGDQFTYLARETALRAIAGPTLRTQRGRYGNALLTRLPIDEVCKRDLSISGREPRGALAATVRAHGRDIRVIAAHLGLRPRERRAQAEAILSLADVPLGGGSAWLIILGDINEWLPRGYAVRLFDAYFGRVPTPPTFPSGRPLFALDRVWVSPRYALQEVRTHVSPLSRTASDHLPLRARIALPAAR